MRRPFSRSLALHLLSLLAGLSAAAAEARTWYVDAAAAHSGDGSASSPFTTLAAVARASAAGDVIVLAGNGRYRDGIALKDGQTLQGAGEGAPPVLFNTGGSVVRLASDNTIAGVKISASSGAAIEGSPFGKTTIRHTVVEAEGAAAAVVLTAARGDVTFDAGSSITVANGTADAIVITGGDASVTFAGPLTIATDGARGVVVRDAGRLAVTGAGSTIRAGGAAAVEIRNTALDVTLESVSVNGRRAAAKAIALRDTTGRFTVTGRGTERASGGRIVETVNRAVELISAAGVSLSNLTLERNALRNGVSASACAGDLINAETLTCNAVVFLHGARDVKLSHIVIDGSNQIGINGEGIEGLILDDVRITAAGDEAFENAVQLRNATGAIELTGCHIERAAARGLQLQNGEGAATVRIAKSVVTNGIASNGQQGVLVGAHKSASVTLDIRESEFSAMISDGVQVTAAGSAQVRLAIANSTFDRIAGAVNLSASDRATVDYTLTGNRMTNTSLGAITVAALAPSSAVMNGVISGNVIGTTGVAGSGGRCGGCHGIAVTAGGSSRVGVNITGNTVQQVDGPGIRIIAGGTSNVSAGITANVVREPLAGNDLGAIRLQSGTGKADTARLCVMLGGRGAAANRISGIWAAGGNILLNNRFAATKLELAELTGTAVATFVGQRNGGATASVLAGSVTGGTECPVPKLR